MQGEQRKVQGVAREFRTLANGFGLLLTVAGAPSAGFFTSQVMAASKFWGDVPADCQTWLAAAAGFGTAADAPALRRQAGA
ncbi:hypothetical protein [Hymenobacter cheonanensis]|uniref:hypothetical protein n=1 Tax=Hymenobacter sp. CA2-7 TaxID=3063993 RepID=UPI002713DF7A|nr:hypothetical protein [Hymenobacter sp. CA2-7]MDO7884222.1 hypothetical protein [Hymenobacter sp. CA2-7]